MIFSLTLSDIVELIIGAIWLIGFIGAIVVGILCRKGEAMRCDVCGKKIKKGTGVVFFENDSVIANFHRGCYRGSSFWKESSKPLNVNKGLMNASKLTATNLRKEK